MMGKGEESLPLTVCSHTDIVHREGNQHQHTSKWPHVFNKINPGVR